MGPTRGEVTTNMVNLDGLSLAELRGSQDPTLLRSIRLVARRTECSRLGALDNQGPPGER